MVLILPNVPMSNFHEYSTRSMGPAKIVRFGSKMAKHHHSNSNPLSKITFSNFDWYQTLPKQSIMSAGEAEEMFRDEIYERGACLVAMVRSILGEKIFLSTMTEYLEKYSYSSIESREVFDLWAKHAYTKLKTINESNDDPKTTFYNFIETWTNRSGFPVVYLLRNMTSNTVSIMRICTYQFASTALHMRS